MTPAKVEMIAAPDTVKVAAPATLLVTIPVLMPDKPPIVSLLPFRSSVPFAYTGEAFGITPALPSFNIVPGSVAVNPVYALLVLLIVRVPAPDCSSPPDPVITLLTEILLGQSKTKPAVETPSPPLFVMAPVPNEPVVTPSPICKV